MANSNFADMVKISQQRIETNEFYRGLAVDRCGGAEKISRDR